MHRDSSADLADEPNLEECNNEFDATDMLLVTANVGSLFEDPERLLHSWLKEFLQKVNELNPQFLALHLQEVGGKTYEQSLEHVQEFIRYLCEADEMKDFDFIRIYMDEDYKSAEHFTALGNLYFVHNDLKSIRIWNFLTHEWEATEKDKNIYSGNIETIATKEKSKFPQHFFPECKWSRKGFMRTRWEINETVFDLVNIHLFHDASNLAACEEFPSVYSKTRRRALVHTLEKFHMDKKNGFAPFFLFGDFNFRCDTEGVVKELTEHLTTHRVQSVKSDSTKIHYRNSLGDNILTVGKKEFNHADHQLKFKEAWLKKFDKELDALSAILIEYPIVFPPSYPYEEDPEMPTDYMSTRCPAWCDRILMNPSARQIILNKKIDNPYFVIGEDICMGDHKPIYLNIRLKSKQGTYRCCNCNNSKANNPNSISLNNPAVTKLNNLEWYCPYKSQLYKDILSDCKVISSSSSYIEKHFLKPMKNQVINNEQQKVPYTDYYEICHTDGKSQGKEYKSPPVSINLIDSDNIYVCMCSRLSNSDNYEIDGSICSECRNIIKKQPEKPRYRLVSKRLMLSNNIIVNRIDTHNLNTYSTESGQQRQDPYTPESAESHSPYPELNSTTTSTSSNNRSPVNKALAIEREEEQSHLLHNFKDIPCLSINENNPKLVKETGGIVKQQRGIVTPGQLKSRLEDLQRSSMNNLFTRNCGGGTAGNSDVDIVDDICQPVDVHERNYKKCLPDCCCIN